MPPCGLGRTNNKHLKFPVLIIIMNDKGAVKQALSYIESGIPLSHIPTVLQDDGFTRGQAYGARDEIRNNPDLRPPEYADK